MLSRAGTGAIGDSELPEQERANEIRKMSVIMMGLDVMGISS
jgi:hypothetical protein